MSHSKIVQISTDPIERKDWIVDTNYYDTGFVGSVADYVADVTDDERKACIEYLSTYPMPGIRVVPKSETLVIVSKEEYFRSRWEKAVATARSIAEMSLVDFATPKGENAIRDMEYYGRDRYSVYVDDTATDFEFGFTYFDDFVRQAKDGDVFYIGGIVDYHW